MNSYCAVLFSISIVMLAACGARLYCRCVVGATNSSCGPRLCLGYRHGNVLPYLIAATHCTRSWPDPHSCPCRRGACAFKGSHLLAGNARRSWAFRQRSTPISASRSTISRVSKGSAFCRRTREKTLGDTCKIGLGRSVRKARGRGTLESQGCSDRAPRILRLFLTVAHSVISCSRAWHASDASGMDWWMLICSFKC